MRTWQKTVIGILTVVLIGVVGAVAYGTLAVNDIRDKIDNTYKPLDRQVSSLREGEIDLSNADPFSVLLLGIDTDEMREGDIGRSDSMMVATINPQKKQVTLVSLPRDVYTEMVGYGEEPATYDSYDETSYGDPFNTQYQQGYAFSDKLNHAYAYGGAEMAIASVEKLLNIPIDHYASVNMDGMTEMIDAVGGVDIDNQLEFEYEGANFPLGKNHLEGWQAVKYSRMRYDDPEGDYGRQKRQRVVLEALFDKLISLDSITNYKKILDVMGDNAQTDLSWDMIVTMLKKYTPALDRMETDQLQGEDYIGDGVTGEYGISYQLVDDQELERVHNLLSEQLEK